VHLTHYVNNQQKENNQMAGFTTNKVVGGDYQFHIDTQNVAERIRHASNLSPVITLQLDGDELDAALWGLENYQKGKIDKQSNSLIGEAKQQLTISEARERAHIEVNVSRTWRNYWIKVLKRQGYSNSEIAKDFEISEATVRSVFKSSERR
jgi:DNA-binding NarL/FixJ family response regulator